MDMQPISLPDSKGLKVKLSLAVTAIFCFFALLPLNAFGQETIESIQFAPDPSWPDAAPGNLEQANGTLFFASGNVLLLLDATSFTETARISLDAPRGIVDIAVHPAGNILYAACGNNGLKVIDISNETSPLLLRTIALAPNSEAIRASAVSYLENHLYMADNSFGLRIYEVSKPAEPSYAGQYEEVSRYTDDEGEEQTSSGGYFNIRTRSVNGTKLAFILDRYLGLRILDVSNVDAPVELDTFDMRSSTYFGQISEVVDLAADDRYVYVSDAAYGVAIIDYFGDPANPETVTIPEEEEKKVVEDQIKAAGSPAGIWLSDSEENLFLADGNAGLLVAEVSDPTIDDFDQDNDPEYPANLVKTESYAVTGAYAVLADGSNVFLANAQNGLARLESDGTALGYEETAAPSTFDPPADATALIADKDYAYVLDNGGAAEGLRIIELEDEDTGRSRLAGFVETPGDASSVAVHESFAWIADGTGGVVCVDISDPDAPARLDAQSFDYPDNARDIEMLEDDNGTLYAFIADSGGADPGLIIAEAGSQGGLTYTNAVSITGARAVTVYERQTRTGETEERYALVANTAGLTVVDVTDPTAPVEKGFLDTSANSGEALDVAHKSTFAVVANGPAGVLLVDFSDPDNPEQIDAFAAEGTAEAVFVQQSYIHTAVGSRGFLLLGISDTEPARITPIDIDPDEARESPYYNTPGYATDVAVAGDDEKRYTYIADTHGGFLAFLHSDQIAGGINEQPFEESTDNTGCFIRTLR